MKVLILTDEQYTALMGGKKIELPKRIKPSRRLPRPVELHHMARNGETPEAFQIARERMDAATDAAEATRSDMHELIAASDDLGIKTGALSRWSGYTDRRIHQIVTNARRAA